MRIEVYSVKGGWCVFCDYPNKIEQYYFKTHREANSFVIELTVPKETI
jgi:hypothetical protein